mmetsp:Transcript_92744/g.155690  ORF Transcript_92744/g.155690 Transcript_92744/m.155690 type:complete len:106 (-) Transcript_92744:73-390(-)
MGPYACLYDATCSKCNVHELTSAAATPVVFFFSNLRVCFFFPMIPIDKHMGLHVRKNQKGWPLQRTYNSGITHSKHAKMSSTQPWKWYPQQTATSAYTICTEDCI